TDLDGNYEIEVEGPESVLVFSFIGFLTQEVTVGNQDVINVSLEPDVSQLEEMVVIGYGTTQREDITGSISSVSGEEITTVPVMNVTNTLAGKLPGLTAVQRSGEPGRNSANISIRGLGDPL